MQAMFGNLAARITRDPVKPAPAKSGRVAYLI
jgi:hypothetical protein